MRFPSAEPAAMLSFLTNAINGLLLLLVAAAPLLPSSRKPRPSAFDFWLRSGLGIAIGVILAESGKRFEIWPGRDTFPSGHETLALAAGTCLVIGNPRRLALVLPLAALQAWALVAGHFHRTVYVAGALITGILPPLGCHFCKRPVH